MQLGPVCIVLTVLRNSRSALNDVNYLTSGVGGGGRIHWHRWLLGNCGHVFPAHDYFHESQGHQHRLRLRHQSSSWVVGHWLGGGAGHGGQVKDTSGGGDDLIGLLAGVRQMRRQPDTRSAVLFELWNCATDHRLNIRDCCNPTRCTCGAKRLWRDSFRLDGGRASASSSGGDHDRTWPGGRSQRSLKGGVGVGWPLLARTPSRLSTTVVAEHQALRAPDDSLESVEMRLCRWVEPVTEPTPTTFVFRDGAGVCQSLNPRVVVLFRTRHSWHSTHGARRRQRGKSVCGMRCWPSVLNHDGRDVG